MNPLHTIAGCRRKVLSRDAFFAQDACQLSWRAGFTLMEMIVVIAIISILMTMVTTVVADGRRQARQTDCKSNLRQMGIAILVYRGEHNGANPPWLSNLYPDYLDDLRCFVCKADRAQVKGEGPVRPDDPGLFSEVIDNASVAARHSQQNDKVHANSYFYEFSAADCSWDKNANHDIDGDGAVKWWEAKECQLRYGDDANGGGNPDNPVPYSQSKLPIVRCYHHHKEGRMLAFPTSTKHGARSAAKLEMSGITINIAYAGNVYVGPLWWEGMPEPGERRRRGGD